MSKVREASTTRLPRPGWPVIISVITTSTSETTSESRMPAMMSGVALGRAIFQMKASGEMVSAWPTSLRRGSTDENPCTVASSAGQIAPKMTTTSDISGERPKIAMAIGITAAGGIGRKISSTGPKDWRASGQMPMMLPRTMPSRLHANHPASMAMTVRAVSTSRVPSAKPEISRCQTATGEGTKAVGTQAEAAATYQRSSRAEMAARSIAKSRRRRLIESGGVRR
jgi:hypothetical protein